MKPHKYFVAAMLVLLLQLALVMLIGYQLPVDAKVPTHWNIHNQIDGWSSRNSAILPFWLFNMGLFLLMFFSGKWSPIYRQNQERFAGVMPLLALGMTSFFALIHVYILLLAGNPVRYGRFDLIYVLIGVMFIFLGNLLPRMPRNFIAGIKTPWTLYSDEIWRKTSRLGGWCFFLLGITMIVWGVLRINTGWSEAVMLIMFGVLIFLPLVYSFVLYLRTKKSD